MATSGASPSHCCVTSSISDAINYHGRIVNTGYGDAYRSTAYYEPLPVSEADLLLTEGFPVGRKHVAALMRKMGIAALYRKPRTSAPGAGPAHRIYPYLLRNLVIDTPNQVWATDITYIPMAKGFLYLVAIMDWASRKVLAWRTSNTLTTDFCVEALQEALAKYGTPEYFNTDQGAQFTSDDFTGVLRSRGIKISMDGRRGRKP